VAEVEGRLANTEGTELPSLRLQLQQLLEELEHNKATVGELTAKLAETEYREQSGAQQVH